MRSRSDGMCTPGPALEQAAVGDAGVERSRPAVDDLGHDDAVAERHAVADVQVGEEALVVDRG